VIHEEMKITMGQGISSQVNSVTESVTQFQLRTKLRTKFWFESHQSLFRAGAREGLVSSPDPFLRTRFAHAQSYGGGAKERVWGIGLPFDGSWKECGGG